MLAGLVHLGDLSATRVEGDTVRLEQETVTKASQLLGLDSEELSMALRFRRVRVVHPGRESLHEAGPQHVGRAFRQVPRTAAQFRHALHSLIKALYKRLFERLVKRINRWEAQSGLR